jgi:hypothetical protein
MIDEPEIRANVIEHNLKPKPEEERAMIVVDGQMTKEPGVWRGRQAREGGGVLS